jgi:hypothetical protein
MKDDNSGAGKKPGQNMVGAGIAIGIGAGVAIGSGMGNVGAGLAIGLALGIAIGKGLQNKKDAGSKER